jgi:hypothetical protein
MEIRSQSSMPWPAHFQHETHLPISAYPAREQPQAEDPIVATGSHRDGVTQVRVSREEAPRLPFIVLYISQELTWKPGESPSINLVSLADKSQDEGTEGRKQARLLAARFETHGLGFFDLFKHWIVGRDKGSGSQTGRLKLLHSLTGAGYAHCFPAQPTRTAGTHALWRSVPFRGDPGIMTTNIRGAQSASLQRYGRRARFCICSVYRVSSCPSLLSHNINAFRSGFYVCFLSTFHLQFPDSLL